MSHDVESQTPSVSPVVALTSFSPSHLIKDNKLLAFKNIRVSSVATSMPSIVTLLALLTISYV